MANRFIDTGFYKSPFVRGLKAPLKGLYTFIICDCTGAGIWTKDLQIASAYIDFEVTEKQFIEAFVKTGKAIDLENGKYFFPDFIEHQHSKGLSLKNPAHNNVILELQKYNLIDENLKVKNEGVKSPLQGSMVMVIEEVTVNKKGVVGEKSNIPTLEEFKSHARSFSIYNEGLDFSIEAKYNSWIAAGWKDGNDKPIKNWKTKLANTMPYLKGVKSEAVVKSNFQINQEVSDVVTANLNAMYGEQTTGN